MSLYEIPQFKVSRHGRKAGSGVVTMLASLAFLFALFPYASLGPLRLPTEVQPWSPLVAWLAICIYLTLDKGGVSRFNFLMLGFGFLFLFYLPTAGDIDIGQYIRKSASYLLCWPLLLMAQFISPPRMLFHIKIASVAWFLFALLGFSLPDQYSDIVPIIVPGALGSFGERGETSLAPEATDFGFTMVYFGLFAFIASMRDRELGGRGAPIWLWLIILANIILSKSGSGIFSATLLGLILILWPKVFFPGVRISGGVLFATSLFLIAVVLSFVIVFMDEASTGIRGMDLLVMTVVDPSSLIDSTLSYRLAHNLVGVLGMFDSGMLGWGAGTFLINGIDVYWKYEVGSFLGLQGWYAQNVPTTLSENALAILPVLLFEYGIFGVLVIYVISYKVISSTQSYRYLVGTLLLLSWAQSFPLAYPLFWLLLGVLDWPESQRLTGQKSDGHSKLQIGNSISRN